MSLTDVSEMLGIPVHTLYRWQYKGDGPVGYRWAVTRDTAENPSRLGLSSRSTNARECSARISPPAVHKAFDQKSSHPI